MNPQRRIVIVDGYSAGRELVRELLERNVECLHLRSSTRGFASSQFDASVYDADLGYAGDLDAAIQLLDELAPDAVVAGSERGAVFAELVARGMCLPTHQAELVGARRRALAGLRLARRPNSQAAGDICPQFALNAVCHDGQPFLSDAWRLLLVTGEFCLRVDGFRLLDPDLVEVQTLFAFARGVLDRLGIREGAAHAQLTWMADGPALVGAAACLAGDPMDKEPYAAAGLDTQAGVLASLLADAGRGWDTRLKSPRYRPTRHMTKLLFTFASPAGIDSLTGLSRLRQLASFHSLHRPLARGDQVRPSNVWFADGGVVYLVHDEAEQISADAQQFRLWERRGELYGLAPLGEGNTPMSVGQRLVRLPAALRPVGAMLRVARHRRASRMQAVSRLAREEWFLGVSIASSAIFLLLGDGLFAGPIGMALLFAILFAVILASSLAVVRHADHLARQLGEPYGTLILTLSVAVIEVVSISAVIVHGDNNPTLVRDSLLSVVMIILNGMVGASLLIGAWRHREQHYNLQGANTYLAVIIPLVALSLVLPCFTRTTPGPTLSLAQSIFLILTSIGLYGAFLGIQTGRHRGYFTDDDGESESARAVGAHEAGKARRPLVHALLLAAYLGPVIVLAEQLARPIDYVIETLHAPVAFGGVALAALVAAPEAIGAVRGAFNNHLQRAVNIFLGSVLATIGLTVPAMLIISRLVGRSMILGVEGTDRVMLLLTLAVSIVTFSSGRTNVLQGAVHLVLFAAYLLLMFQG